MALAVLLIERLSDALAAADAAVPLYLKKRKSRSRSSSYSSLKDLLFGPSASSSSSNSSRDKPELHALVLTKNREIAASLTVSKQTTKKTWICRKSDLVENSFLGGSVCFDVLAVFLSSAGEVTKLVHVDSLFCSGGEDHGPHREQLKTGVNQAR